VSKMKRKVFWSTLVLTILSAAAVALNAARISGTANVEAASETKPVKKRVVVFQEKSQPDVQGLIVALRSNGFSPAAIVVADGRYLFIVQTRVRLRDLTYQLDREGGVKLHEVNDQKLQWKKEFDLQAGTYVLSVVDHPKWHCVITVKAN